MGSRNSDQQVSETSYGKQGDKLLNNALEEANRLLKNDKGYAAYPGQPYTDMSPETLAALQQMGQLAGQGNPFYDGAQTFTNDLITGHYNPDAIAAYGTGIASGAQGITAGNQLQQLLGQGMPNAAQQYTGGIANGTNVANAVDQYGRPIASGDKAIGTEADYRSLMSAVDPSFEAMLGNTLNDVGDQLQRQWGGASYGSAGNADYVTKGIGQLSDQLRSQHFYDNLNFQRGVLGDITGVQGNNLVNQLNAAGMLSGEQGANLGRQLQAAGLISGEQLAGLNSQANILGQIGQFQNQNINNQLNAAGMLSGEQQTGYENQLAGVQMAPSVYAQQYLPAQILAGVGGAYDAQAQKELQALMDQFNIKQQRPFNQLGGITGLLTGMPAQSQTQTLNQASNPLGSIAGGALLASQIIPGIFGGRVA